MAPPATNPPPLPAPRPAERTTPFTRDLTTRGGHTAPWKRTDDGESSPVPNHALLWQSAPCGLLLTDDDGVITHVNTTFTAWTGHRPETVVGRPFSSLLPVGDRILHTTNTVPQLALTGRVTEVAVEVIGADGNRHAALLSAVRTTRAPATHDAGPSPSTHGHDRSDSSGTLQPPASTCVQVALFSAAGRRLYEEELLAARRRAELSESRSAATEATLRQQVLHDGLTGLLNRSGLLQLLHDELLRHPSTLARGAPSPPLPAVLTPGPAPCVFFIDLNGFKTVNDSLGHAAGDELLRHVGQRLRQVMRAGAGIARLSGDEFAIVERAIAGDVGPLCQRLLEAIAEPVVLNGVEVVVSASIGVALPEAGAGPDEPDGPDEPIGADGADDFEGAADLMLRRADHAMYAAKSLGRAAWRVHDAEVGDPTAERLRLLEQLRHSIRHGELRLHYQPRINLTTGRIEGAEALVRWQHPTRGLLPPAAFIDVAEQSGLVRDLGAWVLDEAIGQTVRWDRETNSGGSTGSTGIRMAVNVSARQFVDPHLVTLVASALTRHGLPASRLVLEITETALMNEPAAALDNFARLKALGVHLAIDDFGTGYSSLTYLKRFPASELKIDRSFVAGLTDTAEDDAIVAGCIDLAHALGLLAVAEGVETVQQHDKLTALGCDLAQGYLYARPVPARQFPTQVPTQSRQT